MGSIDDGYRRMSRFNRWAGQALRLSSGPRPSTVTRVASGRARGCGSPIFADRPNTVVVVSRRRRRAQLLKGGRAPPHGRCSVWLSAAGAAGGRATRRSRLILPRRGVADSGQPRLHRHLVLPLWAPGPPWSGDRCRRAAAISCDAPPPVTRGFFSHARRLNVIRR